MLFTGLHRNLPKSPLSRRDVALRAELTHVSSQLVKIERDQEIQFRRIADIQQELDELKRMLKRLLDGK
jgi:uncharacterized sporulation protein YeaH/YhbH (DUF444 family)